MEPEKIPEKLGGKIQKEIIVIIIGIGIVFQFFNYYVIEAIDEKLDAIEISVTTIYGIAAIAAFFVSKHYNWKSHVFGKSYFSLGIGYTMLVVGELIWHYHEVVLFESPYPSTADIFYFAFYPFTAYHLIKNCRYFKASFSSFEKIWIAVIPLAIIIIYIILALNEWGNYEELPFDLFYGTVFVAGASVTISFSLLGVTIFRSSILGVVWLLLALGIFISGLADTWYYYLEIFGLYSSKHVTMALWFTSTLFIIYALIKHKDSI